MNGFSSDNNFIDNYLSMKNQNKELWLKSKWETIQKYQKIKWKVFSIFSILLSLVQLFYFAYNLSRNFLKSWLELSLEL